MVDCFWHVEVKGCLNSSLRGGAAMHKTTLKHKSSFSWFELGGRGWFFANSIMQSTCMHSGLQPARAPQKLQDETNKFTNYRVLHIVEHVYACAYL